LPGIKGLKDKATSFKAPATRVNGVFGTIYRLQVTTLIAIATNDLLSLHLDEKKSTV
jgi:hypothetical protein